MNAKVEAEELIKEFAVYLRANLMHDEDADEDAKQCALIAVDKILDFIRYNVAPYTYDEDSMIHLSNNVEHYTKVKKEIASYGKGM